MRIRTGTHKRILLMITAVILALSPAGCTKAQDGGGSGTDSSESSTDSATKEVKKRYGSLVEFSYSPGYSDMRGAYYREGIKPGDDGNPVYFVTEREDHSSPERTRIYEVPDDALEVLGEIIDRYNLTELEKRKESDEFIYDYSPWSYSFEFEKGRSGKTKQNYVSFNQYRRYKKSDLAHLEEFLEAARGMRGELLATLDENGDITDTSAVNETDASISHYPFPLEWETRSLDKEHYGGTYYHTYNKLPQASLEIFYSEALKSWIEEQTDKAEAEAAGMLENAARAFEEEEVTFINVRDDYTLFRADSRVLSVTNMRRITNGGSAYFADAREKSFDTFNINPETGEDIRLTDVVKDLDAFSELVSEQLYARYVDNSPNPYAENLFESKEQLAQDVKQILEGNWMYAESVYTWAPAYLGLRLRFFDEIASYEGLEAFRENGGGHVFDGVFEVTIPYSMAPELFETAYTALPEDWFARIETETDYTVDLGNGETVLRVEVPQVQDQYDRGQTTIYSGDVNVNAGGDRITVNNEEISEYMNFGTEVYLARYEGNTFLYVGQRGEYNHLYVEVFAAENGTFRRTGHMTESFQPDDFTPLDPNRFYTGVFSYILSDPFGEGRVSLVRENNLGADGMPVPHFMAPSTPVHFTVAGEATQYTLAVDVRAPYWDGLGVAVTETGAKTYPAGTVIRMTETDNNTYALFDTGDGAERMILYAKQWEYGSYIDTIGGILLVEAFVNPYDAMTREADANGREEEIIGNWELRSWVNKPFLGYEMYADGTWETYKPDPATQTFETVSTGTWEGANGGRDYTAYRILDENGEVIDVVQIFWDENEGCMVMAFSDGTVFYGP